MKSNVTDIEVICSRETEKAILVRSDETSEAVWLPKSQIEWEETGAGIGTVTLPTWLAEEKGLV